LFDDQEAARLHRKLVLLQGDPDRCRAAAARRWRRGGIWVGEKAPLSIPAVSSRRLAGRLGSETDLLVFDALEGFAVDAFAMALGLVRGGGRFLLLTPPLERWPWQADGELARLAVSGRPPTAPSRFLQRLVALLREHPFEPSAPPVVEPFREGLTEDQAAALTLVLRTARGHGRRPLLITADRGRGKSALLGVAAARLVNEEGMEILVTAPRKSATETLFRHARAHLDATAPPSGGIRFVAPDRLLAERPAGNLLMVDEAAGVPLPLLLELVRSHGRTVLSTTVHGYEGSGRSFAVRLGRELDRLRPGWRNVELKRPVRWAPGDPLEALGARALLLEAEPVSLPSPPPRADACEIVPLEADRLKREESLLQPLFGLLVSAHYRTKPGDLRYILDAPNLRVWAALHGGKPLGAVLVAEEGELDEPLRRKIVEGGGRPRGHLLPQLLAGRCGVPQALGGRCWRVVRVAVHPRFQGRGLGSRLLGHLLERARSEGVDLVGASFGATARLIPFWKRLGFRPLRLGHRREASSGAHGLLVGTGLSGRGSEWIEEAAARFQSRFPWQLGETFQELDPTLALQLRDPPVAPLDARHRETLRAYGEGRLAYLDALEALHRLAIRLHEPEDPGQRMVLAKVLQRRPWKELAGRFGLPGKKAVEARLRRAVLQQLDPPAA